MRHVERVVELTDGPVVLQALEGYPNLLVMKGERLLLIERHQHPGSHVTTVVFRVNGVVYKTEMDFPDILLTEV